MPRVTLHIGAAQFSALATPEQLDALDTAALQRDAEALAPLPPALRDKAVAALFALHLGIARLDSRAALSASKELTP
jgi:hypothetical protein